MSSLILIIPSKHAADMCLLAFAAMRRGHPPRSRKWEHSARGLRCSWSGLLASSARGLREFAAGQEASALDESRDGAGLRTLLLRARRGCASLLLLLVTRDSFRERRRCLALSCLVALVRDAVLSRRRAPHRPQLLPDTGGRERACG